MQLKKSVYDVTGIGSALLDFMVEVDDSFISSLGLKKGEMHLVDAERSMEIFKLLQSMKIHVAPGGSCANTIAGMAMMGGKCSFIGRVASDDYATTYIDKTVEAGVTSFIRKGKGMTGHAITFITPDSERTFATHLGAAVELSADEIDYSVMENSSILHLEGYLFEPENLRDVCYRSMKVAKESGTLISVDLADPALVGRIKNIFTDVAEKFADIIFVNEEEAAAFTGKRDEEALKVLSGFSDIAIVKLGAKGSIIKSGNEIVKVDAVKTNVINTNGAGDMYAAGFLYGLSSGRSIEISGKIASYAASLAVASAGARVESKIDLKGII
ncbi:MAG TPA: adenosine kinase [Spirochaetota bacterium]|nr:adenosine kinase [Spirochaetota bacterium]